MMLHRLALTAFVALPLALTACDSGSGGDNPVSGVRITSASLIDLNFRNPAGETWDGSFGSEGPDVYLKILVNNVEVRNTQDDNDLDNLSETDLGTPRNFTLGGGPIQLNNLTQTLTVEVWDDDGSGADERIASFTPVPIQTLATEQSTSRTFTDGTTTVRFALSYAR